MTEEEDHLKKVKRLLDSEDETRAEPPIEPTKDEDFVSQTGTTRTSAPRTHTPPEHIALDKDNLPLPRRVHEVDMEGTRVTPVAYESTNQPRTTVAQPLRTPPPTQIPTPSRPLRINLGSMDLRRSWGCILRGFIFALFSVVVLAIITGSVLVFSYYRIARTLPSVDDLKNRASQFETTRILDRNGNPLYEILDPNAGRRTYITLDKISRLSSQPQLPQKTRPFTNTQALMSGPSSALCGKTIVPMVRAAAHPPLHNN